MITSSFPYGESETFLETEFPYLKSSFDKIFIVHSEIKNRTSRIDLPSESIFYLQYLPTTLDKFKYFRFIFSKVALKEFLSLLFHQRTFPRPGILASLAGSLTTGYKLKNTILNILSSNDYQDAAIYAYSYWCNDMATGLALLKIELPDVCCISRAHGYEVYLERSEYRYLPLRKFIFSTLDKVYFVSQHGYEYSRQIFGKHASFKVSYLGVHVNTSSRNQNENQLRVVSCSSIIALKNIDVIIDALSGYSTESIHWTHIGTGKESSKLKSYAANRLGRKPNLTFEFKGHLDNSSLLKLYAEESFDLFLSTSLSEGLPFSMMEAMAYGIPVIGPDVGGIKEIIDHKTNGFLLRPTPQPSDLKLAIDEFLTFTPERRSQMANNAKSTWRSKFNAEKNYPAFVRDLLVS